MNRIFLFLFLLPSILIWSQKPQEIDSLKNVLSFENDKENRMKTYGKLSKILIYVDPNLAGSYNDSMQFIAEELDDDEYILKSIYNGSVVQSTLGNYKESTELLLKCIPFYEASKDTTELTKVYYQMGANQLRLDDNDNAIDNLTKAMELAELSKNSKMNIACLNAIAVIYKQTYQNEKALQYYNKSIDIALAEKDTASLAIVYNGAGVHYLKLDSLDKAMDYFNQAMLFAEKSNNISAISYQHRNRGMVFQQRGELSKALESHKKALDIRLKLGQKLNIGGSYSDLGEVSLSLQNYDEAEKYFIEALEIFKEIEAVSSEIYIYDQLGRLHKETDEPSEALKYMEKYYVARDTLKNNELREKINEVEIKYETEKKEKELALKDIEIKEGEKKKNFLGLLAGLLFVASIFLFYAYRQTRKRKKQEILTLKREHQIKSLETLLEGEEKERQRIAIELHDGVNGDLSALKYKLSALAETNNKVINEAIQMIDNSCEQVRALSHNLTPPSFEKFTLMEVLDNYCHSLNQSHPNINVSCSQLGEYKAMNKKDEIAVFRIIQELLTNALKHAEAKELTVQTSYLNEQLQVTVEDDGIGFDRDKIDSDGIGLRNIDSRIDFLGARMDFSSNDSGTSYVLEIDLK